ncbi:PCYCGC motif-containing (lipo)protein [Bacillus sp. AK031]
MALYIVSLTALLLFITGCSSAAENSNNSSEEHNHEHEQLANGDIREETAGVDQLPSFLDEKDENIKLVYSSAAQHTELLEYIPCYCGCGESAGHMNNLNCFVHKIEDGKVTWDDHGTRCLACLEIAAESIVMYEKGSSIKEIRNYIDETYKEGYAKPTPTPMPS